MKLFSSKPETRNEKWKDIRGGEAILYRNNTIVPNPKLTVPKQMFIAIIIRVVRALPRMQIIKKY